jgi:putative ABC transport system ATP-binding protein
MPFQPSLDVEDLTVRFDGRTVLEGFSLSLAPGEKVTLTGASGAGKTTVLRCLLGFVAPEAGAVRIGGRAVTAESVWALRARLGYVQQEPDLGRGRLGEILRRPFTYSANAALKSNLDSAPEWFRLFGLPDDLPDKDASSLSGGEKQRVALIAAIMLNRPILLLDEASSALDQAGREAALEYLRMRDDLTVLAVSHDPERFTLGGRVVTAPSGSDRLA